MVYRTGLYRRCSGVVYRPTLVLLGSVIVLAGLIVWLSRGASRGEALTVYCAAGLREPMEEIRKAYEAERGTALSIQYDSRPDSFQGEESPNCDG